MGVAQHSVLEISEAAIVLCCGNLWMFKLGQHIEGRITFINGETEWVSGKVVRLQTERVLIMLQPTMPTGRVYGEQLFLRQHRG